MKQKFKIYAVVWGMFFILFNRFAFLIPQMDFSRLNASFWTLYLFIASTFFGEIVCTFIVLQSETKNKLFLKIPSIITSYLSLFLIAGIGLICMKYPVRFHWLGIIFSSVILVLNVLSVFFNNITVKKITEIDEKITESTFFIRSLTIDAETLISRAHSLEAQEACKQVYETALYSDPTSDPLLLGIESEITSIFADFKNAVLTNDDHIADLAKELMILIRERNKKCQIAKKL